MSLTAVAVRYFNAVATVSLTVIVGVASLLGYWLFLDVEPPIANIQGRFIGMDPGASERTAIVEWTGTRQRSCPGITRRWLVDGHIVALPPHSLPYSPPGERGTPVTWRIWVEIPKHLDHPVRYQIEQSYECNPLQRLLSPLMVYPPPVPLWHENAEVAPMPTGSSLNRVSPAPTAQP